MTKGCLYRYNITSGALANSDNVSNSFSLKASGNYTAIDGGASGVVLDPTKYGQWRSSDFSVTGGQQVKIKVRGEISLCKAYIPRNNLQQTSDLDIQGKRIEIPRVEDMASPPLSIILDAKNSQWRNLTELFRNDKFHVAVHKNQKGNAAATIYDSFTKVNTTPADCRENNKTYSPVCGRYSMWEGNTAYAGSCRLNTQCYQCNPRSVCDSFDILGWCVSGWHTEYEWCSCYENVNSYAPEAYKDDESRTYPDDWSGNISDLSSVVSHQCSTEHSFINGGFQNQKYFWFSADRVTGLVSRIDSSVNPTNASDFGTFEKAEIEADQSYYGNSDQYKIIKQGTFDAADIGYLQYRLANDGDYEDNTGGYVLNIKQTKCFRQNGNALNDVIEGRGLIQYVILDYDSDPNETAPSSLYSLVLNADGEGIINVPANERGKLWFKIRNNQNDYQDSFGEYTVSLYGSSESGQFSLNILNPLFEYLKTRIQGAAETIFRNMTCFNGSQVEGSCNNFFNYIRAVLIIYIMLYGMMFLLGMARITQTDLVVRVVKIALVSGLMNDKTFIFFNDYVFDFVTHFSDEMIANMSGYSMANGGGTVSNPFNFMNEVFTKIFLSKTFTAQVLALFSMGLNGIIYFIIVFACICIVAIVGFRALAVYLTAYVGLAVLLGIAPLFLTFILFQNTKYLFDNWVKFTLRYMIEPLVMLAGIIVLFQLFTIYLDYVVGYSVCWKCALEFTIPFPAIPGFNPAFLDVPIFCLNWFAPWGFDHRSGSMGLNMQNMIILLMIAYCMLGYIEYSGKMVSKLTGVLGGASATDMGTNMSSGITQKALSKVGMDSQSRSQRAAMAKERLSSIREGLKQKSGENSQKSDQERDSSGGQSGQP